MDRLLTNAAGVFRGWQQIAGDRILVDKIFPRRLADVIDGHAHQPVGPLLDVGDRHTGGETPAILAGHARLTVGGVHELGEIGGAGAVEFLLRHPILAQILDYAECSTLLEILQQDYAGDAVIELVGGDVLGGDGVEAESARIET